MSKHVRHLSPLVLFLLAACAWWSLAPNAGLAAVQVQSKVVDVAGPSGERIRYLALQATFQPPMPLPVNAAVLLFAGGNGLITIDQSGSVSGPMAENFLVRSRELFANSGVRFVAVVGVPSNHPSGLDGDVRLSEEYAMTMKAVIEDVRQRTMPPVWVIGTSAGSMSAVNVAARLHSTPQEPAGIVLPSPQMRCDATENCGRTVFHLSDGGLMRISRPVLIVYNTGDKCPCSDPSFVAPLFRKLLGAGTTATIGFLSTAATSSACEAHSPHGYHGIEQTVVTAIVNWIRSPVSVGAPPIFP